MIRDLLAALSTVGAIFAWWAVVFLLAGCAAVQPALWAINGAIGLTSAVSLWREHGPTQSLSQERPDATP